MAGRCLGLALRVESSVSYASLIVICSLYERNDLISTAKEPVSASNNNKQFEVAILFLDEEHQCARYGHKLPLVETSASLKYHDETDVVRNRIVSVS